MVSMSARSAVARSTRRVMTAQLPWLLLFVLAAAAGVLRVRGQGAPDTTGFIIIDCGLPEKSSYVDDATKLTYVSDDGFTDAGVNRNVSAEYINPSFSKLINHNVRSFPGAARSCYTLGSLAPGSKYLIRATFLYGNYDGLGRLPVFDLHLGVNFWTTVNVTTLDQAELTEIITVVRDDFVQVCLVNTGSGTPFISGLDLRPLGSSLYPQANTTQGLVLHTRRNFGTTDPRAVVRYPDDPYDRVWTPWIVVADEWAEISTTEKVGGATIAPPSAVVQTAITPRNTSKNIEFTLYPVPNHVYPAPRYIGLVHFAELQRLAVNTTRQFYLTVNGKLWYALPIKPDYLFTNTIYDREANEPLDVYHVSINATANSTLPPIINAIEVFSAISTANIGTDGQDVSAITAIKARYQVNKNWMGDPCAPKSLAWDGLSCSYDVSGPPRITNAYGDNPNLCSNGNSCQIKKKKNNNAIYVAVPIVAFVLVGTLVLLLRLMRKKKAKSGVKPRNGNGHNLMQLENRRFTYRELEVITNNFKRVLGRGGFGSVYDGFLEDGTQVAVKLRSQSSNQGVREFLTEGEMATLDPYPGDKGSVSHWNQHKKLCTLVWSLPMIPSCMLLGLEYLHKACSPPFVHRDVKTSNILLNANHEAKIADFGLLKAFQHDDDTHVSTDRVVGTHGYLAPEYVYNVSIIVVIINIIFMDGIDYISICRYAAALQLTEKSDVYSFGVVLLEVITGQPPILWCPNPMNIVQWVRQRLTHGDIDNVVDIHIRGNCNVNAAWKVADIALKCTTQSPTQRPTMTDVVMQLQECLKLEEGS
ncbi:hypothetical protein PR202_ga05717 [Eleusine coracana subsp. coracana]|uniref:Protein kinase domain-containing protein n=1 Tax=Eleusine coracana subsp. coracana TaxID=191504 RepID=A0AAV5BU83_ELECO|nr:hypothetical protein PR202_ga05717 [Eleusine coracana subsp. coracana]